MVVLRNQLDVVKILLETAEKLNSKGKDYIREIVQATIEMPADAQKRAQEAQAWIDKADALKIEIKRQEDEANTKLAQCEAALKMREALVDQHKALKSEAEAIEARVKSILEENKKKEEQLLAITKQHEITAQKHQQTLKEIAFEQQKLTDARIVLEAKRKEISDYENDVNETAEVMSELAKKKLRK